MAIDRPGFECSVVMSCEIHAFEIGPGRLDPYLTNTGSGIQFAQSLNLEYIGASPIVLKK